LKLINLRLEKFKSLNIIKDAENDTMQLFRPRRIGDSQHLHILCVKKVTHLYIMRNL